MDRHPGRTTAALALLIVVWVAVYWSWEPSRPVVSFADEPRAERARVASDESARADPASVAPVEPRRTSPEPAGAPPGFARHVVQPGETFDSIARARFGEAFDWRVIARANPLTDPERLREGDELWLPADPTNIQGGPGLSGGLDEPQPGAAEPAAPEVASSEPAALGVEYTVRSGDTLSDIARRFYGSARHTRGLFEANRGTLASEDALREGQVIRIPPKADLPAEGGG